MEITAIFIQKHSQVSSEMYYMIVKGGRTKGMAVEIDKESFEKLKDTEGFQADESDEDMMHSKNDMYR